MNTKTINTIHGDIELKFNRYNTIYKFINTEGECVTKDLDMLLDYIWPTLTNPSCKIERSKVEREIRDAELYFYRGQYSFLTNPIKLSDKFIELDQRGVEVKEIRIPCQGCGKFEYGYGDDFISFHELSFDAFEDEQGDGNECLCESCSIAARKIARAEEIASNSL